MKKKTTNKIHDKYNTRIFASSESVELRRPTQTIQAYTHFIGSHKILAAGHYVQDILSSEINCNGTEIIYS